MTKQSPEILCKSCQEFDYIMNRKDGISMDVFVLCECDGELSVITSGYKNIDMESKKNKPRSHSDYGA